MWCFQVDLLRGQKSDRVDVTLAPEELELMDNVLPAKYEEAREEEKLRSQREDFSDMVAEIVLQEYLANDRISC
ncbi:hypothetical protein LIER_30496 [Lithospermum erythrorhizon]|uniref:Uncharacterized protein n=1 Tax=Lithospermum erythrorhizon TaxID=34254 RepID=A0AAV3RR45_LITER